MSLVGSLEDLGLGDILQMLGLSRKSGLLMLRSEAGDGRILLKGGLVRSASVKGEPAMLRELLVTGGFAAGAVVDRALSSARESGRDADEVVAECTELDVEQLRSLRREQVERAVLRMFCWRTGEFSFEFTEEVPGCDVGLTLATGINPEYLTIEATRLGDEVRRASGAEEKVTGADAARPDASAPSGACEGTARVRGAVLDEGARGELSPPGVAPAGRELAPLVVMDSELRILEWLKAELSPLFARVHVFQNYECGVARIRQYLGRGQIPAVLVSSRVSTASPAGATDPGALVRRLRAQVPRMPILALYDAEVEAVGFDAADAVVARPPSGLLVDPLRRGDADVLARALRGTLAQWTGVRRSPWE
ncbi:MAG: DUF4388 domain-containing protein [Myxococcota bacterium]|nr:DUF4388 domain-containing protein [bacterium]MDP6076214.1 DUF4388 domain-containing protein [Myxococcota bacterium]MDP6242220.1 DUF4388 domain-containing protein [Myxococcota bacterium]MDP7298964.1 DUF4388 domain-containing protein [Myxococcota bacterium]MDP7433169.1 DUF4388 domain-containing protein [Myxococcota bacterium]